VTTYDYGVPQDVIIVDEDMMIVSVGYVSYRDSNTTLYLVDKEYQVINHLTLDYQCSDTKLFYYYGSVVVLYCHLAPTTQVVFEFIEFSNVTLSMYTFNSWTWTASYGMKGAQILPIPDSIIINGGIYATLTNPKYYVTAWTIQLVRFDLESLTMDTVVNDIVSLSASYLETIVYGAHGTPFTMLSDGSAAIFVITGYTSSGSYVNSLLRYDLVSDYSWRIVNYPIQSIGILRDMEYLGNYGVTFGGIQGKSVMIFWDVDVSFTQLCIGSVTPVWSQNNAPSSFINVGNSIFSTAQITTGSGDVIYKLVQISLSDNPCASDSADMVTTGSLPITAISVGSDDVFAFFTQPDLQWGYLQYDY